MPPFLKRASAGITSDVEPEGRELLEVIQEGRATLDEGLQGKWGSQAPWRRRVNGGALLAGAATVVAGKPRQSTPRRTPLPAAEVEPLPEVPTRAIKGRHGLRVMNIAAPSLLPPPSLQTLAVVWMVTPSAPRVVSCSESIDHQKIPTSSRAATSSL